MSANALTRTRDATVAFRAMYGALPVAVERDIAKFLRQERRTCGRRSPRCGTRCNTRYGTRLRSTCGRCGTRLFSTRGRCRTYFR